MSALAITQEIENSTQEVLVPKKRRGRPRKEDKTMAETEAQVVETQDSTTQPVDEGKMEVQRTFFDLGTFKNILLKKQEDKPKQFETLSEAQAHFHGDMSALLSVLQQGMEAAARDGAYKEDTGWFFPDEDKPFSEWQPYTGDFASGDKLKIVNAAVLNLAKLQGYADAKTAEEKEAIKENVREFLRKNPAMLKSFKV